MVNSSTADVTILLGKPDGTFQTRPDVYVGGGPTGLAVGDFNGDRIPDLAVSNGSLGLEVILISLGNGDGTFRNGGSAPVGNEPYAVVVGDFNRDRKLDLAVANLAAGSVSVLLGNGDSTFHPAANYPTGTGPVGLKAGDFNKEGKLDLAVCANVSNAVMVFLGNGDGTFQTPLSFPPGGFCNSVARGDLNHDGKPDIVTANTDNVIVLLNASR